MADQELRFTFLAEGLLLEVRDAVGNVSTTASVAVPATMMYLPTFQW